VTELYSIRDVARIFGVPGSRLRYWIQTGLVAASQRRGGRLYYTFEDLVCVKTAVDLLEAGLSVQRVRANLEALRALLPGDERPIKRLRICSDGDTVVAVDDEVAWEPASGQVVMAFTVASLSSRVAEVVAMSSRRLQPSAHPERSAGVSSANAGAESKDGEAGDGVPTPAGDDHTESHRPPTAYGYFLDGCDAEDAGDDRMAEECYRRAIDLEPSLAAAHTNLGNVLYRKGLLAEARAEFELAIELEPTQPEARYNLGNLLDDLGELDHAIAELKRVTSTHPEFADAHYNLGLLLARVGGYAQAQKHLESYLRLDADSEWAQRGRTFLAALA